MKVVKISDIMEDTQYKKFLTVQRLSQITGKTLYECQNILDPYYDFYNKHGYVTETSLDDDIENIDFDSDDIDSLKLEIYNIKYWDDSENKFFDIALSIKLESHYLSLYYSGKLMGEIVNLSENKIIPISVSPTDNSDNIVKISDLVFSMSNKNAQKIENYFKKYNSFIEEHLKRILSICDTLDENAFEMAYNFLSYTDIDLLLDHDSVVFLQTLLGHEYLNFQLYNSKAVNDKAFLSSIEPFWVAVCDFADILSDDYNINEEDKKYCAWELIQRAAIKYFSEIWKEKYESYLENALEECVFTKAYGTLAQYIEDILLCNEIDINNETKAYLTYFLIDKKCISDCIFFPKCYESVQGVFEAIEEKVRKESFKNRLKRGQSVSQCVRYTLDDVDTMTGLEFENFICPYSLKWDIALN